MKSVIPSSIHLHPDSFRGHLAFGVSIATAEKARSRPGHLSAMPSPNIAQRNAVHYFTLFLVVITWLCVFQPVYRSYRASDCSWAAFYIKLVNVFRYFLPILIIFLTDGLWKKTNTFREVPDLSFTGDFIVFAYGHDRSIVSSSYAVLNAAAAPDQLATSQIIHQITPKEDVPGNSLDLQFEMSTRNLSIHTLIYAFVFRMRLDYHSLVDTDLILTDTHHISSPTSQIQTTARLSIDQSIPLEHKQNNRIIDKSRQDVEHFQIHSVLRRVSESPMAFSLNRKSSLYLSAPSPPPSLSLHLTLSVSETDFIYKTGFWELLKWFWIQYFAAFVIVDYFFSSMTSALFRNHVFWVNDVIRQR